MIKEMEAQLAAIDAEIGKLANAEDGASQLRMAQLTRDRAELLETCRDLSPEDKVFVARHAGRPGTADFISALFTDFFECKGDRLCREDPSILGGVALYRGVPVTVIGHRKARPFRKTWPATSVCPPPRVTARPSA